MTGDLRLLKQYVRADGQTTIPMEFDGFQSFVVVFSERSENPASFAKATEAMESRIQNEEKNFPELKPLQELSGAWDPAFDPKWGGPEKVVFESLQDWSKGAEEGIKYYSGIATYRKVFDFTPGFGSQESGVSKTANEHSRLYLDLGVVHDMARVKLNGKELGVVWCAPWRIEISKVIKIGNNQREIEVANRWMNRMIGDKQPADANLRTLDCPPGFLDSKKLKAGRYTFSTHEAFNAKSSLVPSGLLGPVQMLASGK